MNEDTIDVDNLVLSTIDNPYNPKIHYDEWKEWDRDNGYFTEEYVARLLEMEEDFDIDDELKINELLDRVHYEILENDVIGTYILV